MLFHVFCFLGSCLLKTYVHPRVFTFLAAFPGSFWTARLSRFSGKLLGDRLAQRATGRTRERERERERERAASVTLARHRRLPPPASWPETQGSQSHPQSSEEWESVKPPPPQTPAMLRPDDQPAMLQASHPSQLHGFPQAGKQEPFEGTRGP